MCLGIHGQRRKDFEALFDIAHAQDEETTTGGGHRGEVGILDVDFYGGEGCGDSRETAGSVVIFHHQDLALHNQRSMSLQQGNRSARIAHHHANHGVVHRIGNGEAVDVDFVFGERVADLDECARAVGDKDGELFDDADGFHAGDSGIGPSGASM